MMAVVQDPFEQAVEPFHPLSSVTKAFQNPCVDSFEFTCPRCAHA